MTKQRFFEIIKDCTLEEKHMLFSAIMVANTHWDDTDEEECGRLCSENILRLAKELLDSNLSV